MAKAFKRGLKWVPKIEAARMVVRLDQASKRFQTNQEVIFALTEAARTGCVTARGTCPTTQKLKKISPRDWQECHADWGRFALYEPGRRLPRFTHIEFEAAGIEREFAPGAKMGGGNLLAHKDAIQETLARGPMPKEAVRRHVRNLRIGYIKKLFEAAWSQTPEGLKLRRGQKGSNLSKPSR
jgi:hypothetical protein